VARVQTHCNRAAAPLPYVIPPAHEPGRSAAEEAASDVAATVYGATDDPVNGSTSFHDMDEDADSFTANIKSCKSMLDVLSIVENKVPHMAAENAAVALYKLACLSRSTSSKSANLARLPVSLPPRASRGMPSRV
jgi:hypothetical protein